MIRALFIISYSVLILAVDIVHQAACLNDLLHEFRKGLSFEFRAFGAVIDHAAVEIHFHLVAVFDSPACLSALDDGKSDVDAFL